MGTKTRPRRVMLAPPHEHKFAIKRLTQPAYARCTVDWCGVLRLADTPTFKRLAALHRRDR